MDDYYDAAIRKVMDIYTFKNENQVFGDILCFLTGEEEIENACKELKHMITKDDERK